MRWAVFFCAVLSVCLFAGARPVLAVVTYVVNSDADPGNGSCTVEPPGCTLREAITAANANPGPDVIRFLISGLGVHTITVATDLPAITDEVELRGTTQVDDDECPAVREIAIAILPGANAGDVGLSIGSSSSIVRGIAIHGFGQNIVLGGGGGHRVECSNLGVDASGTTQSGTVGISVESANATIGGSAIQANIIGGGTGISLGEVIDTQISFNRIGRQAGDADLVPFFNFATVGIEFFAATERTTIRDNEFGIYGFGVRSVAANQNDLDLRANRFTHSVTYGVQLWGQEAGQVQVRESVFASQVGVDLRGDHSGTVISLSQFETTQWGVFAADPGGLTIGLPGIGGNVFATCAVGVVILEGQLDDQTERPGVRRIQSNLFACPGAQGAGTGIVVQGAPLGGSSGVTEVEISGNTILNAADSGIQLSNAGHVRILNNWIGIDGMGIAGPNGFGIKVLNSGANGPIAIGPGDIISANSLGGIRIVNSSQVSINGVRVGPNASLEPAFSTQPVGISIDGGSGISIQVSLIIGNAGAGIRALNTGALLLSDTIASRNTGAGISLGATEPGTALNRVRSSSFEENGGPGITVFGPLESAIDQNVFSRNGGLSIDLGYDGVTPNDDLDSDEGPNGLLNSPLLSEARLTVDGSALLVYGTVATSANLAGFLDFYATPNGCGPADRGQGSWFESMPVQTDDDGVVPFVAVLTPGFNVPGYSMSAVLRTGDTAINAISSEFSNCVNITSETSPVIESLNVNSVASGTDGLQLIVRGNNFTLDSYVTWNGIVLGGTPIGSQEIQVAVPSERLASPGPASIQVVNPPAQNPPPGDEGSNRVPFRVTIAPAADVNCSGFVESTDALAVMLAIAQLATPNCPADANFDTSVDVRDAIYVRRVVAGLLPE
ncbi:MAG: right-handed parallel beta-helix repeat-containing protein [Dehalococcoidia bacterium]